MVKGVRGFIITLISRASLPPGGLAKLKVIESATFFFIRARKTKETTNKNGVRKHGLKHSSSSRFRLAPSSIRSFQRDGCARDRPPLGQQRCTQGKGKYTDTRTLLACESRVTRSVPPLVVDLGLVCLSFWPTERAETGQGLCSTESSNTNNAKSACNSAIGAALGIRGYTC